MIKIVYAKGNTKIVKLIPVSRFKSAKIKGFKVSIKIKREEELTIPLGDLIGIFKFFEGKWWELYTFEGIND